MSRELAHIKKLLKQLVRLRLQRFPLAGKRREVTSKHGVYIFVGSRKQVVHFGKTVRREGLAELHIAGVQAPPHYRLVRPWTNCLFIGDCSEETKAHDLPMPRYVPTTLAASWGGAGEIFPQSAPEHAVRAGCDMADLNIPAFIRAGGYIRHNGKPEVANPVLPLLALVEQEPSRLEPDNAMELLEEAQLAQKFGDVFGLANELGLQISRVAVIVLAELLKGMARRAVTVAVKRAMARLNDAAERTIDILQNLSQSPVGLRRALEESAAVDLLQKELRIDAGNLTERLANFVRLLDQIRSVAKVIKQEQI